MRCYTKWDGHKNDRRWVLKHFVALLISKNWILTYNRDVCIDCNWLGIFTMHHIHPADPRGGKRGLKEGSEKNEE